MNKIKHLIIFIAALTLGGCASVGTYNNATGRQELIFISTPQEVTMGQTIHKQLLSTEKLSADPSLTDRINRIGKKVALVSDRQDFSYQFYVIEKDELNAFTVPGGNIYIYTGLIKKIPTDDEIAAVLAHEIGHCAARHTIKKYQAVLGYNLLSDLLNKVEMAEWTKQITSLSSQALMTLITSAYGRSDEYEADKLGLKYLDLSGYDLNGMLKTFAVLEKEGDKGSTPLLLRSHPYIQDRITAVKAEIRRLRPTGE